MSSLPRAWHPTDQPPPEITHTRAIDRARRSRSGIGAVVELDASDYAPEGRRWVVLVTDGQDFSRISVHAHDVDRLTGVPPTAVEDAVERLAEGFPAGVRLAELRAASPIHLSAESLGRARA